MSVSLLKNKATYIFLTLLLLLSVFCSLKKEPGKVWNLRGKIVALAENLTGIPYRSGGEEIYGFDCSGLVQYVYGCFGIQVPRTAKEQGKLKNKVRLKRARPGDILVFKIKRKRWHTAIFVEKDLFIHAPNSRERVRKERLTPYWRKRLKSVISLINE